MSDQDEPKPAPGRGSYTIDGIPYQVNEGDPIPAGAEYTAAEEEGPRKEEAKASETTQAKGPKEKA